MTLWDNYRALRKRPAETFSEFLFGEEYLVLPESEIYPGVVEVGDEIYGRFLNNDIDAAFVLAGLGSGKSTMESLMLCAIVHWLLCLDDPHKYFDLLPDKPIVCVAMGPTATQVKNVVYAGIRSFVQGGPFFQQWSPDVSEVLGRDKRVLAQSMMFSRQGRDLVQVLAGHSLASIFLGLNTFFAVVDELSKFKDSEGKSQARELYETLDQRRLSRFGDKSHTGLVLCAGTAGAVGDFVDVRVAEAKNDPKAYVKVATSWDMRGRDRYKGGSFHFIKRDFGPKGVRYSCEESVSAEPESVVLHLADVPNAFRGVAERDPLLFLRDFASIPSLALHPFDMNSAIVTRLVNLDKEHPLYPGTLEAKDWFRGQSGINYYIHVDLGLGREGGDAAGFCLGHSPAEKRVLVAEEVGAAKVAGGAQGGTLHNYDQEVRYEFRPIVVIDLLLRWDRELCGAGEIEFAQIREFIHKLQFWGFDISGQVMKFDQWGHPKPKEIIGGVSYDGWQSRDSVQVLWDAGVATQIFSVDRTTEAYEDLRAALADNRLDYYKYEVPIDGRMVAIFEHEYQRLERVKRGLGWKVDHPEGGGNSKDVSDAVAAVVSRITLDHKRSMGGWV